jgi:tetratricopeptide (TPR) repeat protein
LNKAQDAAARLKASIDAAPNKRLAWYPHLLRGMTELEKKDYSKAIGSFNMGQPLLNANSINHLLFADGLGAAFYRLGDLESARREYAKIVSLGLGRFDYGEKYVLSHYWLGKIAEAQGNVSEAATRYRKFLDLWKDADPAIPEVGEAQKRLAALK